MKKMTTTTGIGASALVMAMALAGCAGSAPDAPPSTSSTGEVAAPVTLNVSYVPYIGPRATFLGISKGIYEDAGITLTMNPVASPAPGVAAIVNGEAQYAFVTMVNLINAAAQGSDIQCVTPLDGPTTAVEKDAAVQLIAMDPDIKAPKDLKGKVVAQVSIGSANDLYTKELANIGGVADSEIESVQLGFAQMPAALQGGSIDAMVASEPFASQAVALGGRVIAYPEAELAAGWNANCWAASSSYIEANQADVERFKAANEAAIAYAAENPDEARAIIPTFLDIPEEVAQKLPLGADYAPGINTQGLEDLIQLMVKHGFITTEQEPSIDDLVFTP